MENNFKKEIWRNFQPNQGYNWKDFDKVSEIMKKMTSISIITRKNNEKHLLMKIRNSCHFFLFSNWNNYHQITLILIWNFKDWQMCTEEVKKNYCLNQLLCWQSNRNQFFQELSKIIKMWTKFFSKTFQEKALWHNFSLIYHVIFKRCQ